MRRRSAALVWQSPPSRPFAIAGDVTYAVADIGGGTVGARIAFLTASSKEEEWDAVSHD